MPMGDTAEKDKRRAASAAGKHNEQHDADDNNRQNIAHEIAVLRIAAGRIIVGIRFQPVFQIRFVDECVVSRLHPFGKLILLEIGYGIVVQQPSHFRIVQPPFQPITDLNAHFALLDSQQQQNPVVFLFIANTPLRGQLIAKGFDVQPVQRGNGNGDDLRFRFFRQLYALRVHGVFRVSGQYPGKIIDKKSRSRLQVRRFCRNRRNKGEHPQNAQQAAHDDIPQTLLFHSVVPCLSVPVILPELRILLSGLLLRLRKR